MLHMHGNAEYQIDGYADEHSSLAGCRLVLAWHQERRSLRVLVGVLTRIIDRVLLVCHDTLETRTIIKTNGKSTSARMLFTFCK